MGEREHLGVRGGIIPAFDRVVGGGNDFAVVHDHAADWHLVFAPGVDGLIECEAHEKRVVAVQLRRVTFGKRAVRSGGCVGIHRAVSRGKP